MYCCLLLRLHTYGRHKTLMIQIIHIVRILFYSTIIVITQLHYNYRGVISIIVWPWIIEYVCPQVHITVINPN